MSITPEEREALKRELLEEIKREDEAEKIRQDIMKKEAELRARKDYLLEEAARKQAIADIKASEEPWCDLMGIVEDPKHGVKIELDWNDAFVKYLKENGIDGPSDEIIVQRWLESISAEVSTDIAILDIEKGVSDGISEFE